MNFFTLIFAFFISVEAFPSNVLGFELSSETQFGMTNGWHKLLPDQKLSGSSLALSAVRPMDAKGRFALGFQTQAFILKGGGRQWDRTSTGPLFKINAYKNYDIILSTLSFHEQIKSRDWGRQSMRGLAMQWTAMRTTNLSQALGFSWGLSGSQDLQNRLHGFEDQIVLVPQLKGGRTGSKTFGTFVAFKFGL